MKFDITKLTPWLPLMIVAGYFLFLIATWMKYNTTIKLATEPVCKAVEVVKPTGTDTNI